MGRADLALVVARIPAHRARLCADLSRSGYDALGFSTCVAALDWLSEETPRVAAVAARGDPDEQLLLWTLRLRGVASEAA